MKRLVFVALAVLVVAVPGQAAILFNNFGSGDSFDTGVGWTVAGINNEVCGVYHLLPSYRLCGVNHLLPSYHFVV